MNLLVLCTDTFRADYLGCYGNKWIKTPSLDHLASEGVRFNAFYPEALPTLPARRVLYTGRTILPYQYIPQKGDQVQLPGWHPLLEEDVTLAEWLSERGYITGLISDVYHQMKPGKNFQRGFSSWQWIRGQEVDPVVPTRRGDGIQAYEIEQYRKNRSGWKGQADHFAAQVMRAAADWIENFGRDQPWMLWVESFDPHEPWDAPDEFLSLYTSHSNSTNQLWAPAFSRDCSPAELEFIKANYAGECSHVDKWCGHALDTLDRLGLANETIVVMLSDHGTMLGEQGEIHKGDDRLRIQVTRCPLIIRHPNQAFAGRIVENFVQHQDLMPTLLYLLGEAVPERCTGTNIWPIVTGESRFEPHDFILSAFGWYASIRTREWNYVAPWSDWRQQTRKPRPPQLYDLKNDPDELESVIGGHSDVAIQMQSILNQMIGDYQGKPGMQTDTPAALPGLNW